MAPYHHLSYLFLRHVFPFQRVQLTYSENQPPLCPPPLGTAMLCFKRSMCNAEEKWLLNISMQQVERQMQAAGQQDEAAMQHLQQGSAL